MLIRHFRGPAAFCVLTALVNVMACGPADTADTPPTHAGSGASAGSNDGKPTATGGTNPNPSGGSNANGAGTGGTPPAEGSGGTGANGSAGDTNGIGGEGGTDTNTAGNGGASGGSSGAPTAESGWMHQRFGIGFHYLQDRLNETKNGGSKEWNDTVNSFDVDRFAASAAETGAEWVLFTLGQNSGYYIAPNSVIDKYSGYKPGERCATRDLAMDLGKALAARDIKFILYLPSNAPARDAKIANGFGLTTLEGNWVPNEAFARKWAEVIKEWATRYQTYVAGWWFDGFYGSFKPAWGKYYQDAARAGNPSTMIALNRGLSFFVRPSEFQDYIAGETTNIDARSCTAQLLQGVQCHIFTPFGSWYGGTSKYTDDKILTYTNAQLDVKAAITWNLGLSGAGVITKSHVDILKRIRSKIRARP